MSHLVTVVIPSYNHGKFINQAIDSVIAQKFQTWELIVVDDGSSDDTHAVLKGRPHDPRIKIILNTKNRGQSACLNQALQIARGEFVCLLPSDDWYLPNKLSSQVEKFLQCDRTVGVVYGKGYRYFSDLKITEPVELPMHRGWILERLVRQPNFIYPITPMFRRECFNFAKPDESYKAEGEAIYLKMAIKYQFDYVDEYIATMRDHSYNTGKMSDMMYIDNTRYWSEFFNRPDIPDAILRLRKIPLSRLHRTKGLEAISLDKRYTDGRKALLKAVTLRPSLALDPKVIGGIFLTILPKSVTTSAIQYLKELKKKQS